MKKTLFLAIFSLIALPTFAFATIDSNLKYGAKGDEVVELQEFLIDKGFLQGTATGNFFALTKKAVISYQSSVGLPATGFVGQLTRTEINKELQNSDEAEIKETGTVAEPIKTSQTDVLKAQLDSLIAQINALKEEQKKTNEQAQQTTQAVQQVVQNTAKPVVLGGVVAEEKPIKKELKIFVGNTFWVGGWYEGNTKLTSSFYVTYLENEKIKFDSIIKVKRSDTGEEKELQITDRKCLDDSTTNQISYCPIYNVIRWDINDPITLTFTFDNLSKDIVLSKNTLNEISSNGTIYKTQ